MPCVPGMGQGEQLTLKPKRFLPLSLTLAAFPSGEMHCGSVPNNVRKRVTNTLIKFFKQTFDFERKIKFISDLPKKKKVAK